MLKIAVTRGVFRNIAVTRYKFNNIAVTIFKIAVTRNQIPSNYLIIYQIMLDFQFCGQNKSRIKMVISPFTSSAHMPWAEGPRHVVVGWLTFGGSNPSPFFNPKG